MLLFRLTNGGKNGEMAVRVDLFTIYVCLGVIGEL
jgi:hypothetical protein